MLCFVTAKYQFLVKDKLMIEEEHDLVYRDIEKTKNNMIIKNDLPFEKADYEEKFLHIQQCYSDIQQLHLMVINSL